MTYRSGLRSGFRGGLALGGHSYHQIVAEQEPTGDLFGPTVWNPSLWQCHNCHLIRAKWEIHEGFYPRPCMGRVRALPAPDRGVPRKAQG